MHIHDERSVAPRPPAAHTRTGAGGEHAGDVIAAPMQGTILQVLVEQGQEVEAGQIVVILEAMKMENHIAAPREGVVAEIPVESGQVVELGETLAVIE